MKLDELDLLTADDSDDDDDEEDETIEEQLTEAVDLLEACHKVLRRVTKVDKFNTKYNKDLVDDIGFFIDSLDIPDS